MGAGGFEPPKHYAADLQSVPIGHSGKLPYSVVWVVVDNLFIIACLFSKSKPFLKIIKNIICLHLAGVLCPRKHPLPALHNVADIGCSNPATWIYYWGKDRIYFYDAKGVSQPPEPCLSRQAGIRRCCLRFVKRNEILPEKVSHFGGSWWIRTTEALRSRFTVCPHWPLGKAPLFSCVISVSLTARLL